MDATVARGYHNLCERNTKRGDAPWATPENRERRSRDGSGVHLGRGQTRGRSGCGSFDAPTRPREPLQPGWLLRLRTMASGEPGQRGAIGIAASLIDLQVCKFEDHQAHLLSVQNMGERRGVARTGQHPAVTPWVGGDGPSATCGRRAGPFGGIIPEIVASAIRRDPTESRTALPMPPSTGPCQNQVIGGDGGESNSPSKTLRQGPATSVSDALSSTGRAPIGRIPSGPVTCP